MGVLTTEVWVGLEVGGSVELESRRMRILVPVVTASLSIIMTRALNSVSESRSLWNTSVCGVLVGNESLEGYYYSSVCKVVLQSS